MTFVGAQARHVGPHAAFRAGGRGRGRAGAGARGGRVGAGRYGRDAEQRVGQRHGRREGLCLVLARSRALAVTPEERAALCVHSDIEL